MDEPFSALDVLTAENLRGELLELWEDKKINTQSVFIVTHNIEEAILLADRIIVLGKNPARIRTNFKVELPRPRDRRSPAFTILVDYVYKILTKPDTGSDVGLAPTPGTAPLLEPEKVKYQMLPHARPGGIAGFLEILRTTAATPTFTIWPTICSLKSTTCCRRSRPEYCWAS